MVENADPRSRHRGAPKRPRSRATLSRAVIQRAALGVVDRLGLEALTIRQLAADLGVTPMAVYRHFENKSAIESALVDLVVGDYDVTDHDEADISDWLCATFVAMRNALCEHPGIIPLLSGATYSAGNALLVLEQVLQRLRQAGVESVVGARLFYVLMAYTIGCVVLMDGGAIGAYGASKAVRQEFRRRRRLAFEAFPRESHPCVVEAAPHLAVQFGGDDFVDGLVGIIVGTLAESRLPH